MEPNLPRESIILKFLFKPNFTNKFLTDVAILVMKFAKLTIKKVGAYQAQPILSNVVEKAKQTFNLKKDVSFLVKSKLTKLLVIFI